MIFKLLLACICFTFLFSCNSQVEHHGFYSAEIARVLSGQTVEVVLTKTSKATKVRITGIDAPDLRQSPWGRKSKERLSELILGMSVKLETDSLESDRFNRINAHIWHHNTLISQKLVKEGCVLANSDYPHAYSKLLMHAQEYARLMGYGIWNPQQALRQTPSQFRSKTKQ